MRKCHICGYVPQTPSGLGGHLAGHTKRGEVPVEEMGSDVYTKKARGKPRKVATVIIPKEEILSPQEVAASLLRLVVDSINRDTNYENQIAALNSQIMDLECELRRAKEEKERAVRANNEVVKQMGNGKIPTVPSILEALRRDPVIIGGLKYKDAIIGKKH